VRDSSLVGALMAATFSLVLVLPYVGYMALLRAPSVVAVRPGLADAGFWTALFSGRFLEWAFYHAPVGSGVATFVLVFAVFLGVMRP
jgi:hypothetical protein